MPLPLYLCIHLRDFVVQVLTCRPTPAVAVLSGDPPFERVFALNTQARLMGLAEGMSRVQAEGFPAELLRRDRHREELAFTGLMACAQRFSPRIEIVASPQEESCGATLLLDISGSERLLGSARQIAVEVRRAVCGLIYDGRDDHEENPHEVSVAASHSACAALLAARGRSGATTLAEGGEAETLAPLPISVLEYDEEQAHILASWGIQTLGELAALPRRPLAARLGQSGLHLQAQARGEHSHLLVPSEEPADAPLCESLELEHAVELLEPLLFLVNRMLEPITTRAAQRALALASVELRLFFEDRPSSCHLVRPALPERDCGTLLKLLQLELELHPPEAAVIALRMEAHPTRPQTAQQGLFAAQLPEPGRMEILLARLRKLVGEDRVGYPEILDSHAPEAFRMTHASAAGSLHAPTAGSAAIAAPAGAPALRILRPPRAVAIELRGGAPVALQYGGERSLVQASSGPWRSNGAWWTHPAWCREEWDVVLQNNANDAAHKNAAGGPCMPPVGSSGAAVSTRCLRLAHDPASGGWYLIGMYD